MIPATPAFLNELDALSARRKDEIRAAKDAIFIRGTTYYVSNEGDDTNDGRSPATPWKTLSKVHESIFAEGDGVLFRRGDLFRGWFHAQAGVTYAAYGEGEKPRLYGWDKNLADPALWELADAEHHIWRLTEPILDCGTLVFNEGDAHSRKLIPSYIGGQFVCRNAEERPFVMSEEMTQDLDLVCFYTERMTDAPSRGENFPVPIIDEQSFGELYLRCDGGNPATVYASIEALPKRNMIRVGKNPNVKVDNLCIKYVGAHAIGGGASNLEGLHVTNCEIGWVGGSIQHYLGLDPNYPEGMRGTVTRYGNGVEIYGGCTDYLVQNCYIYQVYDAGATHQVSTRGHHWEMKGIRYLNNLIEYCVYSIEYFLEKQNGDTDSFMDDIEIAGNILRFSGYGWGQQRHNTHTPAHIKGWSYENTASNYTIHHNLFDRAAYRMLHLVALKPESCPAMHHNTYVQELGLTLGQYGANEVAEPPMLPFDEQAEQTILEVLKEESPTVYYIQK